MANQCAHARVNSNSFLDLLRMAAFVMHLHAAQIMTVAMAFAAVVNAPLLAEIKMIAPMENIARTIDA